MKAALLWLALALPAAAQESLAPADLPPRPVVSELFSLDAAARPTFVGVVIARVEADLGFPVIGTVATRPVETGDLVAKGDALAQLDPEDFDADLRAAEAGLSVASAQLRSAQDAEERARALLARGVESPTRVEDATRALAAAEARVEQAKATLARARDIRSFATLLAPQDGVITRVFAQPGATLAAGQPIVSLAGTDQREIVIALTEQDAANLEIGARFDASLAASDDVTATAVLARVDPVTDRTTRTRSLYLALEEPPEAFRLGAVVRVTLGASSEAMISLPSAAILNRETAPSVWVVDRATNRVAATPVTLGPTAGERTRILTGLTAGQEVVIRGIHSIKDGQTVGPRVTP